MLRLRLDSLLSAPPSSRQPTARRRLVFARDLQRLREVGADVVDVLDADADADHVLADAARRLLLNRHLLVRRRRRVDHQRLRVTHGEGRIT